MQKSTAMVTPENGKTSYLADRIALLARVLLPVWQLETLVLADCFHFSVGALTRSYPALMLGRLDDQKRIQILEDKLSSFLTFAKSQGTVYRISAQGIYLDVFYRSPQPRISRAELLNRHLYDVFPAADRAAAELVLRTIQKCMETGLQVEIDYGIWECCYRANVVPIKPEGCCYLIVNRIR